MLIDSERLYLRPLTQSDCSERYVSWLNDPEVNRFLETRHSAQTLPSVQEYVARMSAADDEFLFGIYEKNGRHIGNIKVGPIHPYHRNADVSLFIGERDCWGRGYASEAITAISRFAVDVLRVEKLSASMYSENTGSFRAFLKAGYAQEGVRRAHYKHDSGRSDILELGLCADRLQ